jgi:hypothetical protein
MVHFIAASLLAASGSTATIEHKAVSCVEADKFPRFEAKLTPPEAVGRARVFFRSERGPAWYAVSMKPEGDVFTAYLPKAKKGLKRFLYYVEVADTHLGTSRTEEFTANVAAGQPCAPETMGASASVAAASVLLEVPTGAPLVPLGFSSAGVTAAGGGAATAASAGAAASSGGGGLGTGVILAGAGVAAAAGGAAFAYNAIEGGNVEIRGEVFANFGPNPANPTGPGLYSNPVVGGTVSTSLDSATTTTDGTGHFTLKTTTPRGDAKCYSITISAPGLPTRTFTGFSGDVKGFSDSNINVPDADTYRIFSLTPPLPPSGGGTCP